MQGRRWEDAGVRVYAANVLVRMQVVDGPGLASRGGEVVTGWSTAAVLCPLDPSLVGGEGGLGMAVVRGIFFISLLIVRRGS